MATREEVRPHRRPPLELARTCRAEPYAGARHIGAAPVVAAIEPRTARVSAETAAIFARRLDAPLVFVSVRPHRSAVLGDSQSELRWIREMLRSRKVFDLAFAAASRNGVMAYGEIVEGDDAATIFEFARVRNAQLVVVASGRARPCQAP